jgi:multidrug resistance efflux pump
MNENEEHKSKRKEWVKNAAIIFLSILLVLTFFSNTIMNYSLPEVATVYVQPGTIATRVRGSGAIEAADPYNVMATESRTIASVPVRVGDVVEKDAVLFILDEKESTEIKAAENELAMMELTYMQELFAGSVSSFVINKVEEGEFYTFEEFKDKVTSTVDNILYADNNVEAKQRAVEAQERRLASLGVAVGGQVESPDELLLDVRGHARYAFEIVNGILLSYGAVPVDTEEEAVNELKTRSRLQSLMIEDISREKYDEHLGAYNSVLASYNRRVKRLNEAIQEAQDELIIAQNALREATERKDDTVKSHDRIIANVAAELRFSDQKKKIEEKKAEIDKLREKSSGGTINAPVAGTITSLNYVAGETTQIDQPVAVIQIAGKGYTLSFSVSNEQAARVQVGDPAEIQNSWWWYDDISVVLTNIRANPDNPGQQKLLTFTIKGENIQAGQQLNVSVGQRSANYELTVPNSAIREDNNGTFILTIETRQTPLNNRYYATRVDVEVLASDDSNTAINAPIRSYEYVITTATKPVTAGQQVRFNN